MEDIHGINAVSEEAADTLGDADESLRCWAIAMTQPEAIELRRRRRQETTPFRAPIPEDVYHYYSITEKTFGYAYPAEWRELKNLSQWVVWQAEKSPEKPDRVLKIPYNPNLLSTKTGETLKRAKTNDPQTWGTLDEAMWSLRVFGGDGVGFVFTEDDPYTGIDLDNAVEPATKKLQPWAQSIANRVISYTELSPSGTGVHLLVKGTIPQALKHGRKETIGVEIYSQGRYFTMTGIAPHMLPNTIEDCHEALNALYEDLTVIHAMCKQDKRIAQLFAGDVSAYNHDDSAADLALCNHLAYYTRGDRSAVDRLFRLSGLMRDKWDEARRDTTYGWYTIDRALEGTPHKTSTVEKKISTVEGGLQVQSARDLCTMDMPPVRWVVPDLIPEGLTLLVGGAKIGKSWAALALGLAMAKGHSVFGYFDTEPGDVLYLALEDGPRRLRDRLRTLVGLGPVPDNLYLSYDSPRLPALIERLADWLNQYPNVSLIVIDVFAKIRPLRNRVNDAYQTDYNDMGPIQRFALDQRIAVVLVHHTNQREEVGDIMHTVSGTTGIIGAADTTLIFTRKRQEANGTLFVTSRDLAEAELAMEFHNGVWRVKGEYIDPQPGPAPTEKGRCEKFLLTFLANGRQPSTAVEEAAKAQKISPTTLKRVKKALGVQSIKEGAQWFFELPLIGDFDHLDTLPITI